MVNRRPAAAMMAIVFAGSTVLTQGSPVPAIPWDLPDAPRIELEAQRDPIMKRIAVYDDRVTAFMAKCAQVTNEALYAACAQENDALGVEEKAIDTAVAKLAARLKQVLAAPCMDHERQLQRDKRALQVQLRDIEQGVRELEELQKESEEEQKEVLLLGASAILGPIAGHLESKSRSAASFQGWLTRHETQLRQKGVPFDMLREKIERTMRGYVSAQVQAAAGTALRSAGDISGMWGTLVTVGEAIGTGLAQGEATFREFLADPTLRPFILDDATVSDLMRTLVDTAASTKLLAKISPQYTVAAFVVDAGFKFTKYESLRAQVMQRHGLTDQMLRAVDALKQQIERTVGGLLACRQTTPVKVVMEMLLR